MQSMILMHKPEMFPLNNITMIDFNISTRRYLHAHLLKDATSKL
jgi:hypothetical protein